MKQIFLLLMMTFSLQFFLMAQNFNNEYGKIGQEDMEFNSYPKDKNAEAVVVSDVGTSYFQSTSDYFDLIYERTTRLKVLKEAGIKWGSIEIPYYREGEIYEDVYDVEACTYNLENGSLSRTNLDVKNCHEEKVNEFWNLKKFAMPNVKEGSVIEYRYKVRSQFFFNLRDWDFQWKIPVISSKYITKMIPFFQYTWLLQCASKFDSQKSFEESGLERQYGNTKFHDMVYEYAMNDIPAFKDEEFIASSEDYSIKLNFQLSKIFDYRGGSYNVLTTWPEMVKDLIKDDDFGGYSRKAEGLASKLFDLKSLSVLPEQQKFDTILNYVKANYNWNSMNGKRASKSPKAFMKDRLGNDADINLFTIGLLNAVGIKSYPVIISTRNNGKIKYDYPFSHFFNYVVIIAEVDGKMVLTDATITLSSNNRIPQKCINDKGLIIHKDKVEWVGLKMYNPSTKKEIFVIDLSDSTQNATIQSYSTEYFALDNRIDHGINTHLIKKNLLEKGYALVDSSIVVKNQTNLKEPYILKYNVTDHPEKVNNKIYVSPFLHEIISENPFKQPSRNYPVDMIFPKKLSFFTEMNIPDGYKIDFIPVNDKIKNDQFELDYYTSVTDKKINIFLIYYFKIPVYEATEYNKLKYYYNEIINKGSEKIVFVKK